MIHMLHEARDFHATENVESFETWKDMNLKVGLLNGIEKLGWTNPSPVQSRAIVPIASGKSMILQSQNGTGKTATFSIGALQRLRTSAKTTELLVISPTRELALQSASTLQALGADVRSCIGGNSLGDDVKALKGGVHCISGTPGRILQLLREHNIEGSKVQLIIMDEADEMLASFKRTITDILQCVTKECQIVVVTATVSEDVVELYTASLPQGLKLLVPRDELTLAHVDQFAVAVDREEWKFDALRDLYTSVAIERAVIFVNTRDKGEWLRGEMVASGFTVSLVHGQIDTDERVRITNDFRVGETRVLIATNVWARGIDVRNVTLVINFDIPTDCDTYLHRIGRSGRFGRRGIAITLWVKSSGDRAKLKKLQTFYGSEIKPLPSDLDALFF